MSEQHTQTIETAAGEFSVLAILDGSLLRIELQGPGPLFFEGNWEGTQLIEEELAAFAEDFARGFGIQLADLWRR